MGKTDTLGLGLPDLQTLIGSWQSGTLVLLSVLLAVELMLRTAEWWISRKTDKAKELLPKNAIVNLLTMSAYQLTLAGFGQVALLGVAFWGYSHSNWRIPLNWWTVPTYFLAAEFWFYFFHRLMHEIRLFWADHSTHHSSTEFDFTVNQRFHLLEWVPRVVVMTPLAMIGFNPLLVRLFGFTSVIQLICHTARFGRWGWWDRYFVSPTNHGVHHARNPIYMDRNLGGGTNIWDRLMGTFQMATNEKMVFGITHAPNSTNLFKVLFWEYTYLGRDFVHAPTLKDKAIVLFGRPGETFEAPARPAVEPDHAGLPALEPA